MNLLGDIGGCAVVGRHLPVRISIGSGALAEPREGITLRQRSAVSHAQTRADRLWRCGEGDQLTQGSNPAAVCWINHRTSTQGHDSSGVRFELANRRPLTLAKAAFTLG